MHVFQFFRDIWTDFPSPLFDPVARTRVIKLTNIDMGEWGEGMGNGGKITGDRSRDVFQNIFAHDYSFHLQTGK